MIVKTVCSGFGGQGILLMGYVLALGGMHDEKNVTCLPAYGAEVRGGTANCTVVIATEEIASPVASAPDFAILLNQPSLARFQEKVRSGGTLFLNASMIKERPARGDVAVVEVPAGDLARQLKEDRVVNMVMLGAFIKKTGLVSLASMERALKEHFGVRRQGLVDLNKAALALGSDYVRNTV
jgi:2-oxoglutarate ferredoxin oxidoreductase subunit gamma